MKRAFTLVEMAMVVAVLGILLTLVTAAASNAAKNARGHRANALCQMVEAGVTTYYAQKGQWPISLNSKTADSDAVSYYTLTAAEVRKVVKALVDETKKGNPMIDVSGLYVSRYPGESNEKHRGIEFMQAVRGTRQHPKKMKTAEMYFGYAEKESGRFRRFSMTYSIQSDKLTVNQPYSATDLQ